MVPHPIPTLPAADGTVALEPTLNCILSLVALLKPGEFSGIDPWPLETVRAMGPERHAHHRRLITSAGLDGLSNLANTAASRSDFEIYLDEIGRLEPEALRDHFLYWFFESPHLKLSVDLEPMNEPIDSTLLASYDRFEMTFGHMAEKMFEAGELRPVYDLYVDPIRFKEELIEHLTTLWETALKEEWQRIEPKLMDAVERYRLTPLHGEPALDLIEAITGRDVGFAFNHNELIRYRSVRFIPHIHSGPYLVVFGTDNELRISFPPRARSTRDVPFDSALSADRFKALGDEIRLQILGMILAREEVSTQEVIDAFRLDKSAASRHLRQLVANNLLIQRREAGAKKVYRINRRAFAELNEMLSRFHR